MAIGLQEPDRSAICLHLAPRRPGPWRQGLKPPAADESELPHSAALGSLRTRHSVIISYVAETDLDTIRASYVALNRGDIQGALDALHREAVWRESPELPGGDDFEGREAIEDFLVGYLEQWDVFRQQVESTVRRGDRVLVNIHLTAIGRESGAEVSARYVHVWTMRDGRGAEVDAFYDAEKALREFDT